MKIVMKQEAVPQKLLIYFIIITFIGLKIFSIYEENKKTIIINSRTKVVVEIANTDEKRTRGLSGRENLGKNDGMLFVYDYPGYYAFWMKGMKFDLDFIWISNDKIVDITENVSHNDQERKYLPSAPVNRVLEASAGFVKKNGIKIGDGIKILSNTN